MTNITTTGELLATIKRLRVLQTEQKVYLSLAGLRSKQTCQRIITHFAELRATHLQLEHLPASQTSPTNTSSTDGGGVGSAGSLCSRTTVVTALTPELRRVCAVLGTGPLSFTHLVMKRLVGLGFVGLALQVAATMTEEDQSMSPTHSSGSNGGGYGSGTSSGAGEEVGVLLDAAVSLCSLAGGSATSIHTKSTRSAPTASTAAVAEPFLVSRALLRSAGTPYTPLIPINTINQCLPTHPYALPLVISNHPMRSICAINHSSAYLPYIQYLSLLPPLPRPLSSYMSRRVVSPHRGYPQRIGNRPCGVPTNGRGRVTDKTGGDCSRVTGLVGGVSKL